MAAGAHRRYRAISVLLVCAAFLSMPGGSVSICHRLYVGLYNTTPEYVQVAGIYQLQVCLVILTEKRYVKPPFVRLSVFAS
jgi:hypothetical protein